MFLSCGFLSNIENSLSFLSVIVLGFCWFEILLLVLGVSPPSAILEKKFLRSFVPTKLTEGWEEGGGGGGMIVAPVIDCGLFAGGGIIVVPLLV